MGKITDISAQKRNKSRVSIYIDGEFVCGLDAVAAAAARLKVGDEVSEDELKAAVLSSELNSAFERAVGYLSLAPRARNEIATYLKDKGYDREVIDRTLEKLDAYRYIDDRAYAESFIKSKSKKYGYFRIVAELKKKGVDPQLIDELTEDGADDGVTDAARKYMRTHRCADKQKLKRFLASRGFSWDSISAAVSALAEEGAFDGDTDDDR